MQNPGNTQAEISRLRQTMRLLRQVVAGLQEAYAIETFSQYGATIEYTLKGIYELVQTMEQDLAALATSIDKERP